ncbi:MAG: FAD:protein FMN transferase [Clostridiales bacterium]|nr:FAD:protein FMN transferase [Clostridiales bacterium]
MIRPPKNKSNKAKTACFLLAVLIAAACLFPCCKAAEKRTATFLDYFDTVVTLTAYAEEDSFASMKEETEAALKKYHRLFDIYNEYEGMTNLASVNRMAGETVEIDGEAIALLELGIEYGKLTDGAVNIAMGAVLKLWHDEREAAKADPDSASLPDPAALSEAAKHCSLNDIVIDRANGKVLLADPEMRLDVGAIAKGFAADRIAGLLEKYGVPFMLNCGGAVLANGNKPDGSPWIAGIEDPRGGGFAAKAQIGNAALSTSGSYIRRYTVENHDYGHIIDPETLCPAEKLLSVSVLVPGESPAALADALSTACFVLGEEKARILIGKVPGAEVLFVTLSGEKCTTGESMIPQK